MPKIKDFLEIAIARRLRTPMSGSVRDGRERIGSLLSSIYILSGGPGA